MQREIQQIQQIFKFIFVIFLFISVSNVVHLRSVRHCPSNNTGGYGWQANGCSSLFWLITKTLQLPNCLVSEVLSPSKRSDSSLDGHPPINYLELRASE